MVRAGAPAARGGCERQDVAPPDAGQFSGTFSAAEEAKMTAFLQGSVAELTHEGYERGWEIWVVFLWDWRGTKDVALTEVEAPIDKAKVVLLFVVYLYTDCDRREEEVTGVLSAVRHFLVTVHKQDVGFLSLEIMRKAKAACKRSPEEVREHQDDQEANTIIPFCLEIVLGMRRMFWSDTDWGFEGSLKKAIWICIAIGTDQGCRPSNLVHKDGKKAKDHTLRNSRVTFLFDNGVEVKAGPAMKGLEPADVRGAKVKLSTHKAGVDSSSGVQVGDGAGPDTVADMAAWTVHWADLDLCPEEGHYARLHRGTGKAGLKGKTVTAKELRAAIKEGCAAFGLPAEVFGSKSMRKIMATNSSLQGVDQEAINERGRWSNKGNTAAVCYSHARATRGKGAAAGGLTLVEVKAMAGSVMAAKAKVKGKGKGRARAKEGATGPRVSKE